RGYAAGGDTRVMVLDLAGAAKVRAPAVELQTVDAAGFGEALGTLHQLGPVKAAAERDRFARSAVPGSYFVVREGEAPIACGSVALDGSLAGVFGMVTATTHRARGLASAIVTALLDAARERGVKTAYLQVEADNQPARRVYQKFGFTDCYAYWYRSASDVEENSR
ncbi:MAG: GNAT family N-acetyltransferase, partial [Burkholderiaceae bacterium]